MNENNTIVKWFKNNNIILNKESNSNIFLLNKLCYYYYVMLICLDNNNIYSENFKIRDGFPIISDLPVFNASPILDVKIMKIINRVFGFSNQFERLSEYSRFGFDLNDTFYVDGKILKHIYKYIFLDIYNNYKDFDLDETVINYDNKYLILDEKCQFNTLDFKNIALIEYSNLNDVLYVSKDNKGKLLVY